MKKASAAILIACALTVCGLHSATNQNAIKALGSAVPVSRFDKSYWQKQHDTNTPEWLLAKRLCEQTVLANYPNCLPVNEIVLSIGSHCHCFDAAVTGQPQVMTLRYKGAQPVRSFSVAYRLGQSEPMTFRGLITQVNVGNFPDL